MNALFIVIAIILALNITVYTYVYFSWKKDCKMFGKDYLAVSLGERIRAAFLLVTLPCLLGIARSK